MPGDVGGDGQGAWTWQRLLRTALLSLLFLGALDLALWPIERKLDERASRGALRNTWGIGIADASRRMLLDSDDALRRRAVVFTGSSVTYGAGIDADETLPAVVAEGLAEPSTPVFNAAQSGGLPRTPIPVAAALGTRPVRLLLVEVLVPAYVERELGQEPPLSAGQRAMLLAASPSGRRILEASGYATPFPERVETRLAGVVSGGWRAYRIRGQLWIDPTFTPNLLFWSVRRWAAELGLLPERFQGQTTNVDKAPWREAYRKRHPGRVQRIRIPTDRIDDAYYAPLPLTQRLADDAGVRLLFYEVPVNVAFQLEFELMDAASAERLATAREVLIERMRADGLVLIEAPPFPDDGFLDKAHVTPLGARIMAEHLLPEIEAILQAEAAR